ncbi:MAG: hypothetical protein HZC38_10000 [Chloroflexi bacterium]|nr:hypothetical protein [Chloroflexota bacterium]
MTDPQQIPLTQETTDILDKAYALWNNPEQGKRDAKWLRDVASLLALGIRKANRPVPDVQAHLSWFLYWMGDEGQARTLAETVLKQYPNEFKAQLTIVWLSSPKGWSAPNNNGGFGVAGALLGLGVNILGSQYSLHKFNQEVTKLVNIFRSCLKSELDASDFLYMANMLLELGDKLGDVPRTGLFALQVADKLGALPENMGRPNLFQEVAQAPTDKVVMDGREQDIKAVQLAAEGRLALGKK